MLLKQLTRKKTRPRYEGGFYFPMREVLREGLWLGKA